MKSTVKEFAVGQHIIDLCRSPQQLKTHLEQVLSTHTPRKYIYKQTRYRPAAVLVPLYFKDGEAHLLFTKRTDLVEHHKGQISFPGGRRDRQDKSLLITALRETEEEVGIATGDVQVVGQTDVFLTNTHYLVTPFIGFFEYPYRYKINSEEIERLVEVPLTFLLREDIFEVKSYQQNGYNWLVHYYHYGNDLIWGVTGFLLSNFLSIAFQLDRNQFTESD